MATDVTALLTQLERTPGVRLKPTKRGHSAYYKDVYLTTIPNSLHGHGYQNVVAALKRGGLDLDDVSATTEDRDVAGETADRIEAEISATPMSTDDLVEVLGSDPETVCQGLVRLVEERRGRMDGDLWKLTPARQEELGVGERPVQLMADDPQIEVLLASLLRRMAEITGAAQTDGLRGRVADLEESLSTALRRHDEALQGQSTLAARLEELRAEYEAKLTAEKRRADEAVEALGRVRAAIGG